MEPHTPKPSDTRAILQRIELRTTRSIAAGRDVTAVGGFLAALHPFSDLVWLNFAVPNPQSAHQPLPEHIDELRSLFGARGRRLRFEYFEELWPELGRMLEARGLVLERRMPVMICSPAEFRPLAVAGLQVQELPPDADDALIAECITTAKRGFGLQPARPEPYEIDEQREFLQGCVYRCAYALLQGRMVGVGTLAQVNDELAGIATLPEFRRRGVASAVSSFLMSGHFAAGRDHVWLSAGDDTAQAVYRKIGFCVAGVQLAYVDAGQWSAVGIHHQLHRDAFWSPGIFNRPPLAEEKRS
jgi:ribosomal protein S18 acetylase RimI-like enzyme